MEFRRVEYFLVLAETLHFHKASEILCISPPALSRQIALLENELGGKLFERTTKTVVLTAHGRIAYEQFKKIKHDWDLTIIKMKQIFSSKPKIIKIGFFSVLPQSVFVNKIINHLAYYFRECKFQFISGEMTELHTMLLHNVIDFCITATNDYEDWSGCSFFKCMSFPARIAVSLLHPWNIKTCIERADIENGSIVLLDDERYLKSDSLYKSLNTRDKTEVSNFDSLIASLEIGENFSIFPDQFKGVLDAQLKFFDLPDGMEFDCYWGCACLEQNEDYVKIINDLSIIFS